MKQCFINLWLQGVIFLPDTLLQTYLSQCGKNDTKSLGATGKNETYLSPGPPGKMKPLSVPAPPGKTKPL